MGFSFGALLVIVVMAYTLSIDHSGILSGLCLIGFALAGRSAGTGDEGGDGD